LFIESYLRDLAISTKVSKKIPGGAAQPKAPRWIPPSVGCAKLNVDAAMSKQDRGGAVGVVCRSEQGVFLGASSLTVPGIADPTVMEAIACREALALAKDLQLPRITVASDCLTVINALKTEGFKGGYSMVLDEVKEDARLLSEASFRHEDRASNGEAHCLARFAVSSSVGRQVWLIQPPDGLCILNNDIIQ
jgi:hypothetical protein